MNTQLSTQLSNHLTAAVGNVFNQARTKVISAADVWHIQSQKRSRAVRRFAL